MKNKNVRIIYVVMLVAMGLFMVLKMVFLNRNEKETSDLFFGLAIGSAIAALIIRLIDKFLPGWFRNKPGREELE